MKYIDNFLNSITMYRLVMWGLALAAGIAVILGFLHVLPYSGVSSLVSFFVLLVSCFGSNYIFSKLFHAPINIESHYITAFILFFILSPFSLTSSTASFGLSISGIGMFVLVSVLAMLSKYILALHKKHIFNPASIALVIIGLFGSGIAVWWVASPALLPVFCILGFLVLRKIQKFSLFFSFLFVSVATILASMVVSTSVVTGSGVLALFTSWPLIFFGAIMLTEPQTTPPTRTLQVAYGALVGLLFGLQFHVGPVYSTPELALVLGNIFAYIVSPKYKLLLKLKEKKEIAANTYEFSFVSADQDFQKKNKKFSFKSGQYLEWTLAHSTPDTRGNRRYFTIASSPQEDTLKLGVRTTSEHPSSFKQALVAMKEGDRIVAGSLAGDFVLPQDTTEKLVFISGGIGVTPFRSMVMSLLDEKNTHKAQQRNIIHIYSNKTEKDIAYKDVFDRAEREIGLRTIYVLTDTMGFIDRDMIQKHVPDFTDRTFYISGPHSMVVMFQDMLTSMGVHTSKIKSDFFPGYV